MLQKEKANEAHEPFPLSLVLTTPSAKETSQRRAEWTEEQSLTRNPVFEINRNRKKQHTPTENYCKNIRKC